MRRRHAWLQVAGWSFLGAIAAGCVLGRVAFTPDSKRFASVVYGEAVDAEGKPHEDTETGLELWVTDVATGAHQLVQRGVHLAPSAAWSDDGKALWLFRGDMKDKNAWHVARWDGAAVQDVAAFRAEGDATTFLLVPPQVAADGKSVLVSESAEPGLSRIVRFDVATGAKTVVAERAGGGVLSPKGDRLAFLAWESDKGANANLCVAPAQGGGERRVLCRVNDKVNDLGSTPLAWSPDGKRVALGDAPDDKPGSDTHLVFVVDVETGKRTPVSRPGEKCLLPLFSADGASLYFTHDADKGEGDVQRVDLATGKVSAVPGSERAIAAGVSPDGKWLALRRRFKGKEGEADDVTVVRLVDLATGATRDDWVTARQRRVEAASELRVAEATKDAAALARAEAALDAMAKQFPGSDMHPAAAELHRRVSALRTAK